MLRRAAFSLLLVATGILLAGCVARSGSMGPVNKISPSHQARQAPSFPDQTIVVLGFRWAGTSNIPPFYRYAVAPVEGSRVEGDGTKMWRWAYSTAYANLANGLEAHVDYHILRLPPGNYVLAYVQHENTIFPLVRASGVSRSTLQNAMSGQIVQCLTINLQGGQSTSDTPFLHARANEVVYVGDVTVDFSDPARPRVALGATPEGARAALATFGETRPMIERPMRRIAGVAPLPVPAAHALRPLPPGVSPCA
jgi:hypothetical protein